MKEKTGGGGKNQPYDEQNGQYGKALTTKEKLEQAKRIYGDDYEDSESDTIKLPDETLPRSLSAKWANYDILAPDGTVAHYQEGSKLHHKEVIAGKDHKRKIDDIERVSKLFPDSSPDDIQKVKAIGTVIMENGEILEAEIHWYQAGSERDEHKIKRYL
ncbi:MAG: hypothetical protein IJF64_03960 [Clostridia bacterium]|nr:hypothetical protein [Clostridia bacterium]